MDFRSKSIYECTNPTLLRRVSVPFTDRKCLSSLKPHKCVDHSTGEVTHLLYRDLVNLDNRSVPLVVRCGKCEHCRKYQNDEWANRMIMEQIGSDASVFFITLSFGEKHYEFVKSVEKIEVYRRYIVPFKKRLRSYGLKFRFYCVSELGEENGRFHFHLLLFLLNEDMLSLMPLAKGFCDKYASVGLDYNESLRLYVRHSDDKYSLQSDFEVYLQCLVMRAWTDSKQRYDVPPSIHLTPKDGRFVKSVSYDDQIGWVSLSQCTSFGGIKYVTSYASKCLHDGVTTYHRQSPGLGLAYVKNDFRGSRTMLESGQSVADFWTYGNVPFMLPRYFVRKFMPEQKRYERFWQWYDSIPKSQFVALLPEQFDTWDITSFLAAVQLKYFEKPDSERSVEDTAWILTLQYIDESLKSGRRSHFTNNQIVRLYQSNIKKLCTKSTKTEKNTSVQMTVF